MSENMGPLHGSTLSIKRKLQSMFNSANTIKSDYIKD